MLNTASVMLDNVSLIRTDVQAIWPKKGGRVVPEAKSAITQNAVFLRGIFRKRKR